MKKQIGFALVSMMVLVVVMIGALVYYMTSTRSSDPDRTIVRKDARQLLADASLIKMALKSCERTDAQSKLQGRTDGKPYSFPDPAASTERNAQNVCALTCPGETQTVWRRLNVECPVNQADSGFVAQWSYFSSPVEESCTITPASITMPSLDQSAEINSVAYIGLQTHPVNRQRGLDALNEIKRYLGSNDNRKAISDFSNFRAPYDGNLVSITMEETSSGGSCWQSSMNDAGGLRILFRIY